MIHRALSPALTLPAVVVRIHVLICDLSLRAPLASSDLGEIARQDPLAFDMATRSKDLDSQAHGSYGCFVFSFSVESSAYAEYRFAIFALYVI